jgi:hypothetical protein
VKAATIGIHTFADYSVWLKDRQQRASSKGQSASRRGQTGAVALEDDRGGGGSAREILQRCGGEF